MIYLDNAATTIPDIESITKAEKFNDTSFFNPSALYRGGIDNSKEIKAAKLTLLNNLGVNADDYEVIFTSCGTESDNLAIFGTISRGVFITDKGEHAAVYNSFKHLLEKGFEVYFCDVKEDGSVDEQCLFDLVNKVGADFVSIMHVNNETGAINDINAISNRLKNINPRLVFHSDGVQAFGKIPYVLSNNIDLYSISAHKINGLKGVGALIKRKKLNVKPIIIGGGQENGFRSGTENIFGIKVFEYAAIKHFNTIKSDYNKVSEIKNLFVDGLDKNLFLVLADKGSPYILSVAANGIRGETLMHALEEKGVIVGNGSACSSKNKVSRVISACGVKPPFVEGVIRISFSNQTTNNEAIEAVKIINETAISLKRTLS